MVNARPRHVRSGPYLELDTRNSRTAARLWLYGLGMLIPAVYFSARYPLRATATRLTDLGILSDYGKLEFALFVGGIIVWFTCYILAIRETRRSKGTGTLLPVMFCGGAVAFLLGLMYPVNATDAHMYAVRSRLFTEYGENPSAAYPLGFPDDPWRAYISDEWADDVSPYGPLWNLVAAPITLVSGDSILLALLGFKALAFVSLLTGAWLIARLLAGVPGANPTVGTLIYLWNPIVLWEGAGNGHNDLLMTLLVLAAIYAWHRGVYRWVIPLLVTAALLKYVAVILIPLAAVALWRRAGSMDARRDIFGWSVVLSLVITAIALGPFYDPGALVDSIRNQGGIYRTSPARGFITWLMDELGEDRARAIATRIGIATLLFGVGWWLWRVWTRPGRLPRASFEILFLFLFAATWNFRSWYLIWLVGVVALLPPGWSTARTIAWTAGAMAVYPLFIWIWGWWGAPFLTVENTSIAIMFGPPLLLSLAQLVLWGLRSRASNELPSHH